MTRTPVCRRSAVRLPSTSTNWASAARKGDDGGRGAVSAGRHRERPHAPPQFRHPDLVPAADVRAERQRRARRIRCGRCGTRTPANNRYPAEVFNINNAARNLLEIIANAARNDDGDYPIRIYTIGMGDLVQYDLGTMPEKPEDILKRIANDLRSPDHNAAQLEGKYYFAKTEADVSPAFQALQNQIIRLTK